MDPKLNSGRINQKHRTRNALLEAAANLMRQGHLPSIEEVADAARVSRATAYRYFPTQEHLLAGSAVLKANLDGDAHLEALLSSDDPGVRLDNVVQAFHERFSGNEVAYRLLLSVMLHQPTSEPGDEEQGHVRASRHVHWLEKALEPLRQEIADEHFERLIAALAASTGVEAFTALRDVSLLDAAESGKIMRWTAQALLKATLAEAPKSR